jgi:hypothetical protein
MLFWRSKTAFSERNRVSNVFKFHCILQLEVRQHRLINSFLFDMAINDVSFNCIDVPLLLALLSTASPSFSSLKESFVAMSSKIFAWPSTFIVVSIATVDWIVEALNSRSKKAAKTLRTLNYSRDLSYVLQYNHCCVYEVDARQRLIVLAPTLGC